MADDSSTEEAFYTGGHRDGVADCVNALERAASHGHPFGAAVTLLKLLFQGFRPCHVCQGDGKNKKPSELDVAHALLISLGARSSHDPLKCKHCHGQGIAPTVATN